MSYGPGEEHLRQVLRRSRAASRSRVSIPEGLSPKLYYRLRIELLRCGPFHSAEALQAIFVDARIHAWYNEIASGQIASDRVGIVIDKLYPRSAVTGENALCQFLAVLIDIMDPGDACKFNLKDLHERLERHCRGGGKLDVK